MQIHQLSACELAAAIHSHQLTATDAVNACLQQIDRHNDRLKAMITVCRDRALSEAQAAGQAIAQGVYLGPLQGIPFTAKDLTPTAGVRTTFGSLIYANQIPTQDELCVARLKAAGAILIGKTNTPEFGLGAHCTNALYGPTANPFDANYSSGGSSGGAAVAVATGMCFLAQGTDMGGSVRTPASFCNVVGLRPAAGRIPRRRKKLLWDYLETDGILTRTVEDAALMLSVMSGEDWRDPLSVGHSAWQMPDLSGRNTESLLAGLRVGVSAGLGVAAIDADVTQVFEQAIARIAPQCHTVTAAHPDCTMAQSSFEIMRAALLWHKMQSLYRQHPDQLSESVRWNVEQGRGISAEALLVAKAKRDQLYLNFLNFFEKYDVLVTVSASIPPFPHHHLEIRNINGIPQRNIIDYLTVTYSISLAGLPAISVPCGWLSSGLPVGLQLVGKPWGETELLAITAAFQAILQQPTNMNLSA